MPRRRLTVPLAYAALAVLLAGCGSSTPEGTPTTPYATPTAYPTGRTDITVAAGDDFSLAVDYNASLGEYWYLVAPKPDRAVLRAQRIDYRSDTGETPVPGAGGTRYYTFRAVARGTTTVTLLHCPLNACAGSTPLATPTGTATSGVRKARRITYTITVT